MCHTADSVFYFFFFQAEDGIRDRTVTGVQTCALPISDSMMPVVKDPLMSGSRGGGGGGENVVRQVVVVPFSSDRPGDRQQTHTVQSTPSTPASTMASTPEMQEEMRKLIDAARSAVADLQAAAPQAAK